MAVILLLPNISGEHIPSPPVHHQSERQEGQLIHRLGEQVVGIVGRIVYGSLDQAQCLKVPRRGYG